MAISSILPNAQEFIKLPPEDRAWVLIAEAGGASAKGLNIHNLLLPGARVVLEGYPDEHHAAVTAAYRGAWQWLQNTDYLLPEGTSPDFLKISPQGIDWYERHPRTVARKLAEFLRGSSLPFTKGRALTKEVTALLGHAALIGERFAKDIEWSFGSVFLAFLVAGDPLSRWFQDFVRQAKIDLDLIPRTTMAEPMKFSDIRNASKSDDEAIGQLLRKRQHRWHQSAQAIFGEAAALAARIGSSDTPLDVRHIMGALIYRPTQNLIELEGSSRKAGLPHS